MNYNIRKFLYYKSLLNLCFFDFINLLIWVRELVPHRKVVLQASPISRSMCKNYMSHITLAQSRMYQIPTREIETELGLDSMDKYIARRQLRWLGHVSRMPFDRLPRRLLSSWIPYKRTRGAPEMTFGKTMIKALKTYDIDPKHWPARATFSKSLCVSSVK